MQLRRTHSYQQPKEGATDGHPNEVRSSIHQGERTGNDCCHGKLIRHETAGIIDEAFAFEDRGETLGDTKILQDGCGSNGVRRRNNRAKDKAGSQRHPGNEPMRRIGNADDGGKNETDSQGDDWQEVRAKILPGKNPSGRKEQRWKEDEKDEFRIEFRLREARKQGYQES